MSLPPLTAIADNVLVHPIDADMQSRSGLIHIPNSVKRRVTHGIVIDIGPLVHEDIEIADHVVFNGYSGDKVTLADSGTFYVVPSAMIVAKITPVKVRLFDSFTVNQIIGERLEQLLMKYHGNEERSEVVQEFAENLVDRLNTYTEAGGFEW